MAGIPFGIVIKDALSGFLNEWIKDYYDAKRKRTKVKYNLGKKIINTISADMANLTERPPFEAVNHLMLHSFGHSKNLHGQLTAYLFVRSLLYKQMPDIIKAQTRGSSESQERMISRFSSELRIMSSGIAIEAHFLMGNGKLNYWRDKIYFFVVYKVLKRDIKILNEPTLMDLIIKAGGVVK